MMNMLELHLFSWMCQDTPLKKIRNAGMNDDLFAYF